MKLMQGPNTFLLKSENQLRNERNMILDQIDVFWFQKSRVDWIRDSDRNTHFYHLSTIIRRRFNRIDVLQDDEGTWIEGKDEVQATVRNFSWSFSRTTTETTTTFY